MKRNRQPYVVVSLAGVALAGLVLSAAAQTTPTPAAAGAPVAVPVTFRATGQELVNAVITSYDGTKLFYRDPAQPVGVSVSVPVATLERFSFDLTYDQEDFNRALMDRNWNRACVIVWPVVSPLLPYLGIKNNNAMELAMTLGNSLVKTANQMRDAKGDEEKANRITQRAYAVYGAVSAAEWSADAEVARLKAILCLITLKTIKQAERDLKAIKTPELGDQTMGLYWYTLAALREAGGNTREAMNAVVKSIAFENKDIEIFPEALMMSARLYEALLETHRARDVYYEVARLFPDTDWSKQAKVRLQSILDQKLTAGKESLGIERTFFGLDEDVNAKASSLIKGTLDVEKPEADMDSESDSAKPGADAEDKEEEGATTPPANTPSVTAPPPDQPRSLSPKGPSAKASSATGKTHGRTKAQ